MAKLSKREGKFLLEMSEDEIRNLVGSLNAGYHGNAPVRTQKTWATFLNGYRQPQIQHDTLLGDPARSNYESPF